MSRLDHAVREAHRAVHEAIGAAYERRRFSVEKFGRHRDGYLHALIRVDAGKVYFHQRFGSWLAPGSWHGRELLKEPEALLGTELGRAVKYELSDCDKRFRSAEHKREEAANAAASADTTAAPDTGGDGPSAAPAGVPEDGNRPGAPVAV